MLNIERRCNVLCHISQTESYSLHLTEWKSYLPDIKIHLKSLLHLRTRNLADAVVLSHNFMGLWLYVVW